MWLSTELRGEMLLNTDAGLFASESGDLPASDIDLFTFARSLRPPDRIVTDGGRNPKGELCKTPEALDCNKLRLCTEGERRRKGEPRAGSELLGSLGRLGLSWSDAESDAAISGDTVELEGPRGLWLRLGTVGAGHLGLLWLLALGLPTTRLGLGWLWLRSTCFGRRGLWLWLRASKAGDF
jgi:hypothetical protein